MLSEDFEGPTNGSELFLKAVTGAQKTVNLRVRPFLGRYSSVLVCKPVPGTFLVLHSF